MQRATGDVNFLVDAEGSDALHDALLAAGARCLHSSADAANYSTGSSRLAPVDFIFARRTRAREMLERRTWRLLRAARLRVPVVDAEALIGLKLQALANQPRRTQDEADIQALFAARSAKARRTPMVGWMVRDQSKLRPPRAARDLDEFLEFLRRLRALFGEIEHTRPRTTGNRFLL